MPSTSCTSAPISSRRVVWKASVRSPCATSVMAWVRSCSGRLTPRRSMTNRPMASSTTATAIRPQTASVTRRWLAMASPSATSATTHQPPPVLRTRAQGFSAPVPSTSAASRTKPSCDAASASKKGRACG